MAERRRVPFLDADDYLSTERVAQLVSGGDLDGRTRATWLASLHALRAGHADTRRPFVLACPTLTVAEYGNLVGDTGATPLVVLRVDEDLLAQSDTASVRTVDARCDLDELLSRIGALFPPA